MDIEQIKVFLNRVPYLGIVALWVLWLAWGYYQFIETDPASPYALKKQEVSAAEQQNQVLRKKIKDGKEFNENLNKKREELRQLAIRLGEMKSTLSEELDIPALIKMVITEAKRLRIRVSSLKPGREVNEEFYTEQSFNMKLRGLYPQIIAFLVRISNAQTIIKIGDVDLSPQGSQDGRFVPLTAELELKAYRYSGSQADEIAQRNQKKNEKGGR